MIRPQLNNPYHDRFLQQNGYCMLPLADEPVLHQLQELYRQTIAAEITGGLYANHNRGMVEQSIHIHRAINNILSPCLQRLLKDYEVFVSHFVVKAPDTTNEFSLHQDWNITDEQQAQTYQIWIPLSAVDAQNGSLFFLPGSHRYFTNYRSGSYGIPLVPTNEQLRPYIQGLTVPMGYAVMFNNSTFHGSFPNLSRQERVSVIINVIPRRTATYYFHRNTTTQATALYAMGGEDLLAHLQQLEKGIIPETMQAAAYAPYNYVENTAISANTLYELAKVRQPDTDWGQYTVVRASLMKQKLQQEGYAVVSFLDTNAVDQLRTYYHEHAAANVTQGRYTSLEHETPEKRREAHSSIVEIISPFVSRVFQDYKIPIAQFFVKQSHSAGDIDYHTDTSLLINQHIESNYAIWIPLQSVNEQNGALQMVPGSHLWYSGIMAGHWPFSAYTQALAKLAVTINCVAGEAIIFDTRIIHSSTFNTTSNQRVAVVVRLVHEASQLYSFNYQPGTEPCIELFAEPDDFYLQENRRIQGAGSFVRKSAGMVSVPPLADDVKKNLEAVK